MRPGQMLQHPRPAQLAHPQPQRRIIDQAGQLHRKIHRVIGPGIQCRLPRRHPALGQVELHHRLFQRHVFHDLVHRGYIVHRVFRIGGHADIDTVQNRQHLGAIQPAVKGEIPLQPARRNIALDLVQM